MERLTIRNNDGRARLELHREKGRWSVSTNWNPITVTGDAIDRLAAYEDLEEQGRLVVLPCKAGDSVFVINRSLNRVFECTVISFHVGHSSDLKNLIKTRWVGVHGNESIRKWSLRQIGRYVFLTREEAERALAGGADHA